MLALVFDPATLTADLALDAGGLRGEDGLATAVIASLFSDRRARPDDPLPGGAGGDRRGWCGDALAEVAGDRFGSRLWLLWREKQTEETRRRALDYAEEALAWLVADGAAADVAVEAEWVRPGVLGLGVTVTLPAGGLWSGSASSWRWEAIEMPFKRPTPVEIRDRIAAEVEAALPGADARTRRSIESVLVRMTAIASHDLFSYLDWAARQTHVMTCDVETLEQVHAPFWGIVRKPASTAAGRVQLAGTAGAVVPAGTELRQADDWRYMLSADAAIAGGGTATVAVLAVGAGAVGNAAVGTRLALLAPVAGVQPAAVVLDDGGGGGLAGGADIEDIEALRGRVLDRVQQPPHGGARFDYVAWALAVPGVTRAWAYPLHQGPGTVGLTFVMDGKAGTILPSPGEVAAVQAAVDAARPVTAAVAVFAPVADVIDLTVALDPNTAAVQAAVAAELADFFARESQPGPSTLYLSRLRAAISGAGGEFRHALTAPAADVTAATGHLPELGTITWTGF